MVGDEVMCLVTYSWEKPDSLKKIDEFGGKGGPTWAHVELTDACNFSCVWCYAGASSGKANRSFMSLERIGSLVDILAASGIVQVTYAGGEPLMSPHIENAVRLASDSGMVVHINSNGYRLTEDLASKLSDAGLSQIQMNIDSLDPKQHDSVRGKVGAYNKMISAFKNAYDAGITCVAQTVLTKTNEEEIYKIMQFARESLNVERCRVWDATPSGTALEHREIIPQDYPLTLKKITEFAVSMGAGQVLSYEPLFPLDYDSPIPITHVPCPSSEGLLVHISVGGNVLFCSTYRDETLYNIFDDVDLISEHQQKIKEFHDSFGFSTKCAHNCEYASKCNKGCPTRISPLQVDYQCGF